MKYLESKAIKQVENSSLQKFSDWNDEGWKLITVKREVSNYQKIKSKLIKFKKYRMWNVKNCYLVGPSGNYYNISGNRRYNVVNEIAEMVSEFDAALPEEHNTASNILKEIKKVSRRGRKNLLERYLDNVDKK